MLETLLLANGLPCEHDKEFYALLDRLSSQLELLQKESFKGGEHIKTFPTSPHDLQHYKYSYSEGPPAMREFPELAPVTKDVRKSSNLYKKSHEDITIVHPNSSPQDALADLTRSLGHGPTSGHATPLQLMANMFGGHASMHPPAAQREACTQTLDNIAMITVAADETQQKTEAAAAAATGASGATASEPDNPSDADAAMRAALAERAKKNNEKGCRRKTQRKTRKKAGNTLGKGKPAQGVPKAAAPAPPKRPLGKAGGPFKKPAGRARVPYVPLTRIPWTEADKLRNRNTFTCLWYGRQKVQMQRAGWSKARMKTELSKILVSAGKVWDKYMT